MALKLATMGEPVNAAFGALEPATRSKEAGRLPPPARYRVLRKSNPSAKRPQSLQEGLVPEHPLLHPREIGDEARVLARSSLLIRKTKQEGGVDGGLQRRAIFKC